MDIGRMRQRIELQQIKENEDILGQNTQQYQTVATVWATVTPTKDREYYEADKLRDEMTYSIYIRYREGVTADMRIVYKTHIFEIKSVIDRDFRHEMLELVCIEKINKDGEEDGNANVFARGDGDS